MKLVFIHGSGMSSVVWQHQLAHFENAEALDLPGHPAGKLATSINEYVLYLESYLSKQSEDIVIIGHSLGSAVALTLAERNLPSLKGMILIGSGARLRVMPMLLEQLSKCAAKDNQLPAVMFSMNEHIEEPLKSSIVSAMKANGAAVMLNDLSICDRFDVMDSLGDISLPTLVLVGDRDQMTPPKYADFLVKGLGKARMEVIEGGTHMVFAEKPMQVNRFVADFIAELSGRN